MMAPPGAPPEGPPGGAPSPPAAAGIMTPQPPNGKREGAKVDIKMAVKVLVQTLASFDPGSPEFKAVMGSIKSLEKVFGEEDSQTQELMPAEIKQLLQGLSGPGQMPGAPPGGAAPPPPPPMQ